MASTFVQALARTALPAAVAAAFCAPAYSAHPLGSFAITEFMADPTAVMDVQGEWIEIQNLTAAPRALDGLRVESGFGAGVESFLISGTGVLVPGGGFALLARNAASASNGGLPAVAYAWGSTITLGNGADYVQIRDEASGTLLFRSEWTSAVPTKSYELAGTSGVVASQAAGHFALGVNPYNASDFGTPGLINFSPCTGCTIPAVPEPHEWMLFVAGLGLMSAAIRRRRAA